MSILANAVGYLQTMASKLNESAVRDIKKALQERFGDPITGVPATVKTTQIVEAALTCEGCGCMMEMEPDTCEGCGSMAPMAEIERPDNDNDTAKPVSYEVVDSKTGIVVGKSSSRQRARISADQRDAKYGAYRYTVRPVYAGDK